MDQAVLTLISLRLFLSCSRAQLTSCSLLLEEGIGTAVTCGCYLPFVCNEINALQYRYLQHVALYRQK